MTLTTTTTTNKMPTTAINASANANAQKKQQPKTKMIAKWSGSDEPQSYYNREDDDGITLKTATKWYDVKYPEYDEYPYDDGCDLQSGHDDDDAQLVAREGGGDRAARHAGTDDQRLDFWQLSGFQLGCRR